jgi:hypothetical protein
MKRNGKKNIDSQRSSRKIHGFFCGGKRASTLASGDLRQPEAYTIEGVKVSSP